MTRPDIDNDQIFRSIRHAHNYACDAMMWMSDNGHETWADGFADVALALARLENEIYPDDPPMTAQERWGRG